MLATFMEVLDSTVVNVSLPHIAGSLATGTDEATWVLTSYLVSNAIVLPTTGWFSRLFGRKRFYMGCVTGFTIASALCGFAPSLTWLIIFRVLQGLAGGALQPISQAILLESFPLRKRGLGMAIFGIGVVFAPIIGPTLGGWITDSYSWRWVFFINIPVGILSLALTQINVTDPPYLVRGVAKVDYFGLGLLAVGIGTLQIILDKGQRSDWFSTPWITQFAVISIVCLVGLVLWELRSDHPIIDFSVFKLANFPQGVILIFTLGVALYGSLVLLPVFLQNLLGYTATQSGLVMSPGGVGTLVCMPIVGYLVGKIDARYMIVFGLVLLGVSMFMQAGFNLEIGYWDIVIPRIVMGIGLAFLFVPISTVTFSYTPRDRTGTATGLFNLVRNIGGSVGIAFVTTMLAKRAQFHQFRLTEHINSANPNFTFFFRSYVARLMGTGQTYWGAQKQVLAGTYGRLIRQATTMSFIDVFWLLGVIMIVLIPVVFIMKKPPRHVRPVEGAH